jgi:hypothetical protein
MSTISIDFRFIAEKDSSPLIVFGSRGDILFINDAAEIVTGYLNKKELFSLAMENAPKSFGTKTTLIDLSYRQFSFYAINVCYMNDDWIAMRLYYRPISSKTSKVDRSSLMETDINMILDATLAMFEVDYRGGISLFVDQNIPPFMIDQNSFSRILRKTLDSFISTGELEISLKFSIGEYMVIEESRYRIVQLSLQSDTRLTDGDVAISGLSEKLRITPSFDKSSITLDIPFIQKPSEV